jgi:hypothetical protein
MAVSNYSITLERDLRGTDRDFKRNKDQTAKWMHGARPLNDPKQDGSSSLLADNAASLLMRPNKKLSENSHNTKKSHNSNKPETNWDLPAGRMRAAAQAKEEMQDAFSAQSLVDLLLTGQPTPVAATGSETPASASTSDLPVMSMPLEYFVKATGREIEKLVEKEYAILDENGQLLKGRKARHNLRHGTNQKLQVDEGFELL